ncbi:hypothetical protein ACQP2F_43875 [Actinoplanes sp. CA-030573]|uniref:hypothetical protein n=1 Tax=Actinoplanes sp. CA-030573 TaxID=3239898 RepID=UPI003D8ACEC2
MTQTRLQAATGLSRENISRIECGQPVTLKVLRAYVTGLGGEVDVVARVGRVWLTVA